MQREYSWKRTLLWVSFYSIAMGFLESAVVVYLRRIYYPYGFDFPLVSMDVAGVITEITRELATMIMLLSVSILSGNNGRQRFAYFLYSFALWDIFYYVFLYFLIDWPSSLMTWDILFLIPVSWAGPIITPVIVSFTMIALALLILISDTKNRRLHFNFIIWCFFVMGSLLLFLSFIWDYSNYLLEYHNIKELLHFWDNRAVYETANNFIPNKFNWFLFMSGEILFVTGIVFLAFRRNSEEKQTPSQPNKENPYYHTPLNT